AGARLGPRLSLGAAAHPERMGLRRHPVRKRPDNLGDLPPRSAVDADRLQAAGDRGLRRTGHGFRIQRLSGNRLMARNASYAGNGAYPDSYHAASRNIVRTPKVLEGATTADIAVLGAGYSGLSTAIHLAEKGYKV